MNIRNSLIKKSSDILRGTGFRAIRYSTMLVDDQPFGWPVVVVQASMRIDGFDTAMIGIVVSVVVCSRTRREFDYLSI